MDTLKKSIHLTEQDHRRLTRLIEEIPFHSKQSEELENLRTELRRAIIKAPDTIPSNIVTMNSRIRFEDADSGTEMIFDLVYPEEADLRTNKISIFSPIGTALIGYSAGDTIEWPVPSGIRRLKIKEIIYQPESAGDHHL